MAHSFIRYSGLAALAGALILAAGCGRANDTALYPAGVPGASTSLVSSCGMTTNLYTACPYSGMVRTAGGACIAQYGYYGNDFSSRCQASYGTPVNSNVCKFTTNMSFSASAALLSPGMPCGGSNTGITMRAGDRLTVSSVSGKWGTTSQPSAKCWLGGLVCAAWESPSCSNNVSATGIDSNTNQQVTNLGLPAGVVGSDGVNVFAIGSGLSQRVAADGMLRVGFNIPESMQYTVCGSMIQLGQITLSHCEDASGNTVACP